jgi:CheY-like chemotaxis protein
VPAKGRRALVVEDESLVAMLVEDMLADLGCEVVATAARLEVAVEKASTLPIDFAVLDVNLAGQLAYPVADALRERGIPFLFATGYGASSLAEGYRHLPALQKPFGDRDLARALASILGPTPAR